MDIKKVVIFLFLALVIFGAVFVGGRLIFKRQKEGIAGLKITSVPQATIFLDSRHLGRTPYEDKLPVGEYILKLVPETAATTAASWQGKVKLSSGVLTYVNRELGPTDLVSTGEILSLEKIEGKTTEIAVLSSPEGAIVKLDDEQKGATPLSLRNIPPGDHEILISSPGFLSRKVQVRTTTGFKLTADFSLAISGEDVVATQGGTVTPAPGKEEVSRPYVQIKETPTGWLRIRIEPSTSATEAAKVKPGEKYPFLEEKSGWYKIQYEEGKEGWISGKYAEKFE